MCIFKYSGCRSNRVIASCLTYVISIGALKNYVNINKIFSSIEEFGSTSDSINPKTVNANKIRLTDEIRELIRYWRLLNYKCKDPGMNILMNNLMERCNG